MKPLFKRLAAVTCGAAALYALSTTAMAQDKLDLVWANVYQPGWPSTEVWDKHSDEVFSRYSGGRLTVQRFFGGKICSEHKCWEQAEQGSLDLFNISVGNAGAFGQTLDFLILPYLFPEQEAARAIMRAWLHDYLNEQTHEQMGMHILGWVPFCGYRQMLHNVGRTIRVPGDLKGVKIRTTKSPAEFALMKAWGSVAVPYDWTQVWQGLQTGIIQGMFNMECHLLMSKFHEVMKYSTHVNGAWHILMMNILYPRYQELPKWAQTAIDLAGLEFENRIYEADNAATKATLEELAGSGKAEVYYPTPDELKIWQAAAVPVWKEFVGTYDPKIVRRILSEQGMTDFIESLERVGAL